MRIAKSQTVWMNFSWQNERGDEGPSRTRCVHCYREFRTLSNFRPICRNCGAAEDDPVSFERVLTLVT
jgi:hypothetical protein